MKNIVLLYDFLLEEGGLERVMATQAKHLSSKNTVFASFATINNKLRNLFPEKVQLTEHSYNFRDPTLKIISSFLDSSVLHKHKNADLFISHSFICSKLCYHMKKRYKI